MNVIYVTKTGLANHRDPVSHVNTDCPIVHLSAQADNIKEFRVCQACLRRRNSSESSR